MTAALSAPVAVDVHWPSARRLAYECATVLPAEPVALPLATGRVLAAELRAATPVPTFTASAMDGWAIRGPGPWRLEGRVAAGDPSPRTLATDTAAAVSTGAPLPHGAEAVLRLERGVVDDEERLHALGSPLPAGADVRYVGEELARGAELAPAGAIVTPPLVGLAAATGHDTLPVRRLPAVAGIVLGEEIVARGTPARGHIRDAIGVQLPGWLTALGAELTALSFVGDRVDATTAAIAGATADIVVTTGGSSVGRHDHVRAAVECLGGTRVVDGVAILPGHPMLLATLPDGRTVVGLPGNPGAAVATLLTLLAPLVDGMLGHAFGSNPPITTAIAVPGDHRGRRHRLVPATARDGLVTPTGADGAAMLSGWARATHALVAPPSGLAAGAPAATIRLPW